MEERGIGNPHAATARTPSRLLLWALAGSSVLLTFASFELAYRAFATGNDPVEIIGENLYRTTKHPYLGGIPEAGSRHTARKYAIVNGHRELIFEATYTIDASHRRIVGDTVDPDAPHLLLFGGSFLFGEGIEDRDTLQHRLHEHLPTVNVYNYAVHGWGTSNMLGVLESRELPAEVQSNVGHAVYGYLWFHAARNIGSITAKWTWHHPYYEAEPDGRLASRGTIREARPVVTALNAALHELQDLSQLARLIPVDFGGWFVDEAELTARIVIESRRRYERLFDGRFLVLDHPLNRYMPEQARAGYEHVLARLEQAGVPVLRLPIQLDEHSAMPHDGHPTAALNAQIARMLIESPQLRAMRPSPKAAPEAPATH